jgi:hypothetical protein
MTPEQQASLLAKWLESPGSPPPDGLDPDVVESMLVLRPELAPAPRVSLDDILAGVSEGPFHADAAGAAGSEEARRSEVPISEGGAEIIDFAARRRRRTRIWGGVGAVAAAALVLFTVLPSGDKLMDAAPTSMEEAQADFENQERGRVQEQTQRWNDDPAPAAEVAAEPAPSVTRQAKSDDSKPAAAPKVVQEEPSDVAYEAEEEYVQDAPAELSQVQGSAESASYGPDPSADAVASAPGSSMDSLELGASADEARKGSRDKRFPSLRGGAAGNVAENDAVASMDDGFAYETAPEYNRSEGLPTDLDGLRAAAKPQDYRSGWYIQALDGTDYDRFEAAVESARTAPSADGAAICAALIDDADARIGQDMAFRAASYAWQSGDTSAALRYLRQGQNRSSLNTPYRANLYLLEGRILEQSGDIAGAQAAYTVAANLNQAR